MKTLYLGLMVALSVPQAFTGDVNGTAPRAEASRYPGSAQQGQLSIGAQLLTAEQIRRAFATELSQDFVVVEVAVFPGTGSVNVSRSDFAIRTEGSDSASRPLNPRSVASTLSGVKMALALKPSR